MIPFINLWLFQTLIAIVHCNFRYPTIVWHPMNPLFGCKQPRINANIDDLVNLQCPTEKYNFFEEQNQLIVLYENLYFLGTNKHRYNSCNATGARLLLNCKDNSASIHTLWFLDIARKPGALTFIKGKTYYFIGTGFRTQENLNQTVNGSCRQTDEAGKYKLKFQVYICKDNEVCDICKSAGCYYKHCYCSWSSWSHSGSFQQTRTCKDEILGEIRLEHKVDGGRIALALVFVAIGTIAVYVAVGFASRKYKIVGRIQESVSKTRLDAGNR